MVRKHECAYLCNGKCLLCKGDCHVQHQDMTCPEAVRRAAHSYSHIAGHPPKSYDLWTAKGRFDAAAEGERGFVVYRSCKSKRRFNSESVASKRAKEMTRRFGEKQRAYYCKFCNGYHLTTKCREELEAHQVAA